ncbi:putative fatty acyl-CoA reductase CG5065 [Planococcus citri]|uniref:putative fatty acyl-CoA reductase CG5065 n=1 Tax=Planococcus citri TaxID=170843 RepID=UPI0031F987A0
MANESQISSFYAGKKILITGGTGTLGKVLIWKLLQSCPEVDSVYVLMRPKHGKDSMSRKEELFSLPIFENFKTNNPKVLDKVKFISGDVGEEGIGLSVKDRDMLIDEVSVVFHSAAVLKMDANLRTAVNVNTVGTARMLDVAQQMKRLEAFVHVSTAFCCCENHTVEEKIYPAKHNPQDIIDLTQWMEPEVLEQLTSKLIHPLPNTYIYSKRLTEALLHNYESKVPIIVARPSIVVPAIEEPLPGWNDSLNGPVGLFTAGGTGIMRTSLTTNVNVKSDVIPVDIAINSILTLPWANSKEQLLKEISVYNITQTAYDEMVWGEIIQLFLNAVQKYPFDKMLWYPSSDPFSNNIVIYTIKCIFLHYLPAYLIDFILLLVGQKPFVVRVHDKLRQGEKVLRFFTQQQWTFLHDKVLQIEGLLNDADKRIFPINMNIIMDIQKYAENATIGVKIFIFKEDMKNLNTAKKKATIMYVLDKITLVLKYFILWKILLSVFNAVLHIFQVNLLETK